MTTDLKITFSEEDIEALCRERLKGVLAPEPGTFTLEWGPRYMGHRIICTFKPASDNEPATLEAASEWGDVDHVAQPEPAPGWVPNPTGTFVAQPEPPPGWVPNPTKTEEPLF